jgi:hypothetical protein
MAETPKDRALALGKPPDVVYVSFRRDPLNPGADYFEGEVWLREEDARADAAGEVHAYHLARPGTELERLGKVLEEERRMLRRLRELEAKVSELEALVVRD